jgi:predicted metal-dependent phosphoesterase TrpH
LFKIDLHLHSTLGGDSLIKPEEVVPRAIEVGLDAVCVTEHGSYSLSRPFEKISEETGFPIFRGLEYSAYEGHLLIYGVRAGKSDLPANLPMQKVITWVRERGGAAIPAHPFQKSMMGARLGDRIFDLKGITALEGLNGSALFKENELALKAGADLDIPCVGGSDAHGLMVLGRMYTEFERPVLTEDDLVQSLLGRHYRPRPNLSFYPELEGPS